MTNAQFYFLMGTLDMLIAAQYQDNAVLSYLWGALGIFQIFASIVFQIVG